MAFFLHNTPPNNDLPYALICYCLAKYLIFLSPDWTAQMLLDNQKPFQKRSPTCFSVWRNAAMRISGDFYMLLKPLKSYFVAYNLVWHTQSHSNPQTKKVFFFQWHAKIVTPWNSHTVKQCMGNACTSDCSLNWHPLQKLPSHSKQMGLLESHMVSLKEANAMSR